eukprot:UN23797
MFFVIGCCYTFALLLNERILVNFEHQKLVILCMISQAVGCLFLTNLVCENKDDVLQRWQIYITFPIITISFCVCSIQLTTLITHLAGKHMKNIGAPMT